MATQCPKCQFENTSDSKFCKECGTQLGTPKETAIHTKTLETPFPQFSPGTSLAGRYEIIKELGKGGMGEVYLAEDKNLKRQVAIKVLPQEFALDKERLARFEREARVLASLNHPNIATIHGLEKADGQQLLVMELVEGETLAERIAKGPLSLEETLDICRQIAEGLESAHEKGVIHRDLKPGNIKITPTGTAKILDFGLAKAYQEEPEAIDLSKSPTLTDRMTQPGVILGTAAYMSPEQSRSHPVDKRTDIWAFGCVLYECLTGKMAFSGETFTDTLAHILKGEPDWTLLPSNIPNRIRILLHRCLHKDPIKRLHDIADARIEMDETESPQFEESLSSRRFSWGWLLPISAACITIGIFIGFFLKGSRIGGSFNSPVRTIVKTEPGYALAPKGGSLAFDWPTRTAMAISKDGSFIVYCAVEDNNDQDAKPQLFMKSLSDQHATPIPGTEGGIAPFLSPDDRWVGFWADGKLWKTLIDGGAPQELCESPSAFGASWGVNGRIVFASGSSSGLYRIPSDGGRPEVFTEPDFGKNEFSHRLPHHLPDGKGILFTISKRAVVAEPWLAILDFQSKKWEVLLEDASDARYVGTGHILFLRQGTLMAVPFDVDHPEDIGQPVSVLPDVIHMIGAGSSGTNTAAGQYGISESGSLVYVSGGIIPDPNNQLVWVDLEGNLEPVCAKKYPFIAPRLSPDGKRVLYRSHVRLRTIGIYDIERDIHSTLMSGGWAIFSPLGNDIVFDRYVETEPKSDIFIRTANGEPKIKPLIKSPYNKYASSFSPDGNFLAYLEYRNNQNDILIYNFQDQSSSVFTATEYDEIFPDFSPNGRWIAYSSNEDGIYQVYVRNFSGSGEKIQISRDGGWAPLWARSGKKLFYVAHNWDLWVTDVLDENKPSFGSPRRLFKGVNPPLFASSPVRGYDISLDDQRFLTNTQEDRQPQPVTEMNLIQNWFEELKRHVPTGK